MRALPCLLCAGFVVLAGRLLDAQEAGSKPAADGLFVGSVGCKSSSCHGGAGEKRSQYLTWSRQDFHTRAYAILLDARSTRIAESLGPASPVESARCTVCHAPFQSVTPDRLSAGAHGDEGVSCESCHGAAGGWLRGHTRPDWTYAMRVSAGLHDLRNLYVRASGCVACHQNVDKEILQAGHPALVFELDSQSVNEPKHWREADPWMGARAWLTGQAVALREAAWRARTDADPAPDMQETTLALGWLLAKVTLAEPMLPKINEPDSSDVAPLQQQADLLARSAATWKPNPEALLAMLRGCAESEREFKAGVNDDAAFYRARRVLLAIDRLTMSLNQNGAVNYQFDAELAAMRQETAARGNFDPVRFADHLKAIRAQL